MMRKAAALCLLLVFAFAGLLSGQPAGTDLDLGKTLRADYIFSGTDKETGIALAGLHRIEGWAGRRVNMDVLPLRGNGQIVMRMQDGDGEYSRTVYASSFSTLFQEWQATEEATRIRRSFENVFLLPMPARKAEVTVTLFDVHGGISCSFSHVVDPSDILIRPCGQAPPPHEWIWKGGGAAEPDTENLIDIAIVAEGYTEQEEGLFMEDARRAMESLWAHEPFGSMKDRFNIVAVKLRSRESGVSVPREGRWKDTAVSSHFDTFYSDRYLTTLHVFKLHDALAGIPYEHLIILANTDTYGGGGIYNSYTLTTAHHPGFLPVVVHEFGHSFTSIITTTSIRTTTGPTPNPGNRTSRR